MINLFLDVISGAQNPMSQTMTIVLFAGLLVGLGLIGSGIYLKFGKKEVDMQESEEGYDSYDGEIYNDDDEVYVPKKTKEYVEPQRAYSEIEVGNSIKTNAYKVRDSIRIAHDIDDDVLRKNGYLAMLCDGIESDEDTPAYISKRIMDKFYSEDRQESSIQDFFENIIDKLDAEIMKFTNSEKSGTSLLACVLMNNELYIIGVGAARLYHFRSGNAKQLTSEHTYSIELDNRVKKGELDVIEAQNDPHRNDLISYIGVGGVNYIDMNDVPIIMQEGDILLFCSDGLYNILSEDEIIDTVNGYEGIFQNCAKVLTTAAMEKSVKTKDNDISALMIKTSE